MFCIYNNPNYNTIQKFILSKVSFMFWKLNNDFIIINHNFNDILISPSMYVYDQKYLYCENGFNVIITLMQICIFSIITLVSHDPYYYQYWNQLCCLIIFVKTDIFLIWIFWWIESLKVLFKIEIFCNIINVITVNCMHTLMHACWIKVS